MRTIMRLLVTVILFLYFPIHVFCVGLYAIAACFLWEMPIEIYEDMVSWVKETRDKIFKN